MRLKICHSLLTCTVENTFRKVRDRVEKAESNKDSFFTSKKAILRFFKNTAHFQRKIVFKTC